MPALATLLSARDRERLAARLTEWVDTDREMRRPGSLASPPPPTPLHLTGRGTTADVSAGQDATR